MPRARGAGGQRHPGKRRIRLRPAFSSRRRSRCRAGADPRARGRTAATHARQGRASRVDVFRRTAVPALVSRRDEDGIVARLFQAGAGKGGHVAFTTEAGLYQAAGIPTVVCGPGDIAQAHTADEFIAVEQLALCEGVLARLLAQ
ncbi:M20/M25/M40 family metallo-hydrolase [Achromobacter xylosoxidans]